MKITNNSQALQGINTLSSGVVFILPGVTRELEVSEGELSLLRRHPFLAVEVEGAVEQFLDSGDKEKIAALRDQVAAKDDEIDVVKRDVAARDGEIVSLKRDLAAKDDEIAKLKAEFEAAAANDEPSSERDELKKQAVELGITFARNITTDKLRALIDAKLAA